MSIRTLLAIDTSHPNISKSVLREVSVFLNQPVFFAKNIVVLTGDIASQQQIESLRRIDQRCFPGSSWDITTWKQFAAAAHNKIILYQDHRQYLGFALISTVEDEAELLKIGIDPKFACKGMGSYLLSEVVNLLRHSKIRKFFLEVRADNQAALNLYQKFAFQKIGNRKQYYRHPPCDALTFLLTL